MWTRLINPSVMESNDHREEPINPQFTKKADMATYVIKRVQSCNELDIPIFLTKIGYKLRRDSDVNLDNISKSIIKFIL